MNGYKNAETFNFISTVDNDFDLYEAVKAYTVDLLDRHPWMTDQTLGRNIKDRVFAWANGGGWGYDCPPRFQNVLQYLDLADYGRVNEEEVAESVRDALDVEEAI